MSDASPGRKRSFETLLQASYAKYGVTAGVVQVIEGVVLSCGVICRGWPSWAFGAALRGWEVSFLLVKDSDWVKELAGWFPRASMHVYKKEFKLPIQFTKLNYWFSDSDPPRSLNLWKSYAKVIVSIRRARHVDDSSWTMTPFHFQHSAVGGATDASGSLYVYAKEPVSLSQVVNPISLRDLSGILDSKIPGTPCPAPLQVSNKEPKVIQVRPNTYHGGGLLPWTARNAFIIAPCCFSPTNWVRRRLSSMEMCNVLDIPIPIAEKLSQSQIKTVIDDIGHIPLKVILQLLDSLPTFPDDTAKKRIKTESSVDTQHQFSPSSPEILSISKDLLVNRNLKAAKNDDAPIPEFLWDNDIVPDNDERKITALTPIRTFALRWWWRHTTKDFLKWLNLNYSKSCKSSEFERDLEAGRECIYRCCQASWWEWTGGSRPLFWRWPLEYQSIIRDGLPPWIKGPLPRYLVPQRGEKDMTTRSLITSKLRSVRDKGYIIPGDVRSLISYFTVPKRDGDVRMVYDASKSGLNSQLWAPWFLLPTMDSHIRSVEPGSFMGDIDLSEQFLNFMLHKCVQAHAGVDLTPFFSEELSHLKKVIWEHWVRCGMGFVSSPYTTVQGTLMAEEVIRGDPLDPSNVFRWNEIVLNLPGSPSYKPWAPWVYKTWTLEPGQVASIANDLRIYVDDVRTIGQTYEECRLASRVVASKANYLGIQDAARKRRDPSQTPGPWAGTIVHSNNSSVTVSISVERWNKAKGMIAWIKESILHSTFVNHKTLESYRGFLIYISRTYPALTPYLKGIHLTLGSCRPWRSDDAWKMSMSEIRQCLEQEGYDFTLPQSSKPPVEVRIAPHLLQDIEALDVLFSAELPPVGRVRPSKASVASYMLGDASGSGFGSSFVINNKVYYQHGQWNFTVSAESSNYRELSNLINAITDAHDKDLLLDTELFIFTDNFTAESAFFKGTSSSRKLFELILSLHKLQMRSGMDVHMIHICGKRMIAQGTDGLSRGVMNSSSLECSSFLDFVPLHKSALDRQ